MTVGRIPSLAAASAVSFGLWCSLGSPLVAEIAGVEDCDYVCIDTQHGVTDSWGLVAMLSAVTASGSASPLVRVLRNDAGMIGKALDAGAEGVVVPMVNTAEEAAHAVAACRYPPEGVRSYGPFRAGMHLNRGRDLKEVNRSVLCFAMVETAPALAHLDDICATEGLVGIYVGPSDLTVSMGADPRAADPVPSFDDLLRRVALACRDKGLIGGIHARGLNEVERYVDLGFGMITLGTDAFLLRSALSETLKGARRRAAAELR